jgi:uncharacterized membrane protein
MRQVKVQVPRGRGSEVLDLASQYQALNCVQMEASDRQALWDLVMVYVSNNQVGKLIDGLEKFPDFRVTVFPQEAVPMVPPKGRVAPPIRNVTHRSPTEVWLNGLQSVGTWKGFLGYAFAASIVVWIGMFTGSIYLLVAAMLIAPFAGPAMNIALASAAGDRDLLRRNLVRYFVSLLVTIGVTAGISLLFDQKTATTTMVDVSELSSVAVLLPLTAGAAGALNMVQAESSSLVAGTAVGLLIAASLAPPAGLIGMALAVQRWSMALNGAFTLLLQLFAINLAGALVFRLYGLSPRGTRYKRGQPLLFHISVAVSAAALMGMVFLQFYNPPSLQRSSRAQEAVGVVQEVIAANPLAEAVEVNMRFTRPRETDQETLLGIIYVHRAPGVDEPTEQLQRVLTNDIQGELRRRGFAVTPLIDVTVLEAASIPPPSEGS